MHLKSDILNRFRCSKSEIQNKILKTSLLKGGLALPIRWNISKRLLNIGCYKNRLVTRCHLTRKSRAVFRCFRLNRLAIASYQAQGYLKSIHKASW